MNINLTEEAIEEMTYHTNDPEKIYDTLLSTIKSEIIEFIEDIVKRKSHYPKNKPPKRKNNI